MRPYGQIYNLGENRKKLGFRSGSDGFCTVVADEYVSGSAKNMLTMSPLSKLCLGTERE